MTELAEIAQAVAKALGLEELRSGWRLLGDDRAAYDHLNRDGSNVFSDPWFRLALEWLRSKGYRVNFAYGDYNHSIYDANVTMRFDCPAVEFPARAIAALEREER